MEAEGTAETVSVDRDYVVFYKESGLPTVPLKDREDEDTLLLRASRSFPEILSPWGRNPWEGSILHRLDTPTSGLVIAARSEDAYRTLSLFQERNQILKTYVALVSPRSVALPGFPPCPYELRDGGLKVVSSFRSYGPRGASVRPVAGPGGPRYVTEIERIAPDAVKCTITRGFRHQIRCHLSWLGMPIAGDERYGGVDYGRLMLESVGISFPSLDGTGMRVISIRERILSS